MLDLTTFQPPPIVNREGKLKQDIATVASIIRGHFYCPAKLQNIIYCPAKFQNIIYCPTKLQNLIYCPAKFQDTFYCLAKFEDGCFSSSQSQGHHLNSKQILFIPKIHPGHFMPCFSRERSANNSRYKLRWPYFSPYLYILFWFLLLLLLLLLLFGDLQFSLRGFSSQSSS